MMPQQELQKHSFLASVKNQLKDIISVFFVYQECRVCSSYVPFVSRALCITKRNVEKCEKEVRALSFAVGRVHKARGPEFQNSHEYDLLAGSRLRQLVNRKRLTLPGNALGSKLRSAAAPTVEVAR